MLIVTVIEWCNTKAPIRTNVCEAAETGIVFPQQVLRGQDGCHIYANTKDKQVIQLVQYV